MDVGSGIAIAGTSFSIMGLGISAIRSIWQSKGTKGITGNGNGFNKELCDEKHNAIRDQYSNLSEWMGKIDDKVDRLLQR